MTDDELLIVLKVMASRPEASEHQLIPALTARGFSRASASKLAILVPMAFAHILLAHLGVTDTPSTVLLRTDDGATVERPLVGDPIFTSALALGSRMHHGEGPRHLFKAAVARSAEFAAINKALFAGAQPAGLKFLPPTIHRESLEDWDP